MRRSVAPEKPEITATFTGAQGFSLVEMLVAAVIFSLGLGGLSLMMLTSVHGTVEARDETLAVAQLSSLAELILMNPASLGHNTAPAESCADPVSCSGVQWAADNLEQWHLELQQNLALATSMVCRDSSPQDGDTGNPACDGVGATVVKIFWADQRHADEITDGNDAEATSSSRERRFVLELPE